VSDDRHRVAELPELIQDPNEKARQEAENGIRQFNLAVDIIRAHVQDAERPFRLRPRYLLRLNHDALKGIHPMADTYRNGPAKIGGSKHTPTEAFMVAEEVEALCDYVNDNWQDKDGLHLSAYVLWRLNWIHRFADGNGRTARALSYVVLCTRLDGLLPGSPTIPDQIADDKKPYYKALEIADDVEGLGTEGGFRPPGFRGFQLMQSLATSLDCVR
jgi:fido (protein-threonine AMPylation protein)